jgi:hypothetical protein
VILGGVSANEVNFFAFGLHENSGFKILMEHEGTKKALRAFQISSFRFQVTTNT